MASSSTSSSKAIFVSSALVLLFCVSFASGGTVCEKLEPGRCAYAVSSSGMRCVLEKGVGRGGQEKRVCRTSGIEAADGLKDRTETDECVQACGLDRNSLGVSSDSLLEPRFTEKLCSARCSAGCPNVVDLYFNLAAAEGVFLPRLCEAQGANPRRAMAEIRSSGVALATAGPASGGVAVAAGPAPAVSFGKLPASSPAESPM